MTISIGELVWYRPTSKSSPEKHWGVGMVTKIWKGEGTHPLYQVRWQKPKYFYYPNFYAYQLVKVTTDA